MNISVKQTAPESFAIDLENITLNLDRLDLMRLAMAIDDALYPVSQTDKLKVEVQGFRVLLDRLNKTDDQGMRQLLREVPLKDLQIVSKLAEGNRPLIQKIFSNLSKRAQTVLREDINERFKEPVSLQEIQEAVEGIMEIANELEANGRLHFHETTTGKIKF